MERERSKRMALLEIERRRPRWLQNERKRHGPARAAVLDVRVLDASRNRNRPRLVVLDLMTACRLGKRARCRS